MQYVEPLTFKFWWRREAWDETTGQVVQQLEQCIKKAHPNFKVQPLDKQLEIISDEFYHILTKQPNVIWTEMPSDTRYPGFFSSLTDHAVATAALATCIGVELAKQGVDLLEGYPHATASPKDDHLNVFRESERALRTLLRFLGLFHDIGKHPHQKHYETGPSKIREMLTRLGMADDFVQFLADVIGRHHYGQFYKEPFIPKTKLDWVIAFADKIAVQDRMISTANLDALMSPLQWLHAQDLPQDEKEKVKKSLDFMDTHGIKVQDPVIDLTKVEKMFPRDEKDFNVWVAFPLDEHFTFNVLERRLANPKEVFDGKEPYLSILIIEIGGIQEYIQRSSARRYLTGSSSLVEVASRQVAEFIKNQLSPEVVISESSGSIIAIVPHQMLKPLVEEIRKLLPELLPGIKTFKSNVTNKFRLVEVKHGMQVIWRHGYQDPERTRLLRPSFEMRNFGTIVEHVFSNLEVMVVTSPINAGSEIPAGKLCRVCSHEAAVPENDCEILARKQLHPSELEELQGKICATCCRVFSHDVKLKELITLRIKNISRASDSNYEVDAPSEPEDERRFTSFFRMIDRIKRVLEEKEFKEKMSRIFADHLPESIDSIELGSIKTTQQLGQYSKGKRLYIPSSELENLEKGEVALIVGDGDNFGSIKRQMSSITMFRQITQFFEEIIEGSLSRALVDVLLVHLEQGLASPRNKSVSGTTLHVDMPFQLVYYGGDDFVLLLDAGYVFVFLRSLRRHLQQFLGKRTTTYQKQLGERLSIRPIGLSIGVAVAGNREPLHLLFNAAKHLETLAKRKSKKQLHDIEMQGKDLYGGEITVALHRFTSIPSLEEINERYEPREVWPDYRLTRFPLSGDELISCVDLAKDLFTKGLSANRLRYFIDPQTRLLHKDLLEIQVEYRRARLLELNEYKNDPAKQNALQKISELLTTKCPSIRLGDGSVVYELTHLDLADFIEMVMGSRNVVYDKNRHQEDLKRFETP